MQQNHTIKVIGRNLENNILKQLADMLAKEREKYEKFWNEYGRSIKAGVYNSVYDPDSKKDKLADLLLFMTNKEGKLCTLKEYTDRMPDSQKAIYFATGKDKEAIEHLPQMEAVKDKGTRNKLPTSAGSLKKQESSRKTSTSTLLTMPKPLTVCTKNVPPCSNYWMQCRTIRLISCFSLN